MTMLSNIAEAFSVGFGYKSLSSKVANGLANADSSNPMSRIPLLPPNLSIKILWMISTYLMEIIVQVYEANHYLLIVFF